MADTTLVTRSTRLLRTATLVLLLQLTLNAETTTAQTTSSVTTASVTTSSVTTPAPEIKTTVRFEIIIVFELQAVWALIVLTAILAAETQQKFEMVKHLSCFGPLPGVVISIVVIALLFAPPNSGTGKQVAFNTVLYQACISAGLSIGAMIAAFVSRNHIGYGYRFSYTSMSLLTAAGLMTSISGTVMSAVNIGLERGLAGVILGSICIVLMSAVFAYYMYRICGKRQSAQ